MSIKKIAQHEHGSVKVWLFAGFETVCGTKQKAPISNANVTIRSQDGAEQYIESTLDDGCATFSLPVGHNYSLELPTISVWDWDTAEYQSRPKQTKYKLSVSTDQVTEITFSAPATTTTLGFNIEVSDSNHNRIPCADIVANKRAWLKLEYPDIEDAETIEFFVNKRKLGKLYAESDKVELMFDPSDLPFGEFPAAAKLNLGNNSSITMTVVGSVGNEGQDVRIALSSDSGAGKILQSEGNEGEEHHSKNPIINTITSLTRTETSFTEDMSFWTAIRNSTEALSFNKYLDFMDKLFNGKFVNPTEKIQSTVSNSRFEDEREEYKRLKLIRRLPFTDSDVYRVLKAATEAFVMVNCAVLRDDDDSKELFKHRKDNGYFDRRDLPKKHELEEVFSEDYLVGKGNNKILPYLAVIRRKLPDIPFNVPNKDEYNKYDDVGCYDFLQNKLNNPCLLELIWSYWHEEGMLVQSMNAITRRFQNIRSSDRDPLANMEIDPLRPLNNVIWSYIQDEQHRLNVSRRNYEYDHHYGLRLEGKAVQNFRPADTRSKFLEAFHHLLRLCTVFYRQDDHTTVKADAFPILNALKEVHLILSQGAHNQFGDLPSTARIEMLMQQWLLARPEFREFLPTRVMVAYPEPWMDRVDAMKKIQGWTNTSVLHFRDLGLFGEQLLLSVRWGHWSDEFEPVKAFNWARFFRPQVQGYIHAYRSATSVDLSADPIVNASVDATLPSILLQKQLDNQQRAS